MSEFLKFVKSIFSEADGTGSTARILSALFALSAVYWITHLVHVNHAVPPLSDITTLIAAPYGVNKISTKIADAVAALGGKKKDEQ
jgi:hypothetical protein